MDSYIKCGDCLELMQEIPDKSVDMILSDLPYGMTRRNKWDTVIPFDELWGGYHRVMKDNAAVVLFGDEPYSTKLRMSNLKEYRYDWFWLKSRPTGFLNANRMPLKNVELVSVFYKKLPIYNPQMRTGFKPYTTKQTDVGTNYDSARIKGIISKSDGERFPTRVLEYPSISFGVHPTQKPVELLEYLIRTYTNKGGIVLDNCMGVGSTCVACINTGRKYIGFEIDQNYFEIAEKRIEEAENERRKNLQDSRQVNQ